MQMLADMGAQNAVIVGCVVLAALVVFWILRKIVKLILSIVIVTLIAAVALFYCVRAGYISREDAERLNPLNNEQIRQAAKDAGAWAGTQAKNAAKKAADAAVGETIDRLGAGERAKGRACTEEP